MAPRDGEEGSSGRALEDIHVARLRDLRDGLDALAVARHGHERGRGGKVPIPQVVADGLEMPESLARAGIECEQGVGEQVVTDAVRAVEVRRGGARRGEDDPALLIHGDARPCVGASRDLPRVRRPRVVAVFAGARDRMEYPAELAALHVVGADVARRGGQRLADGAADDEEIAEHDARRARAHRDTLARPIECVSQVRVAARVSE